MRKILVLMVSLLVGPAAAEELQPEPASPPRGVMRPANQATLATDLSAPVAKSGFKEGEAFHKGDTLIAFDCRRHRAELASAEAAVKEMTGALESNAFLEKMRAIGKQEA